jgi:hypothetical protein
MTKSFEAKVLSLRPEFSVTDGYFYYVPAGHILCGFVWEKVRDHAYIWRFAMPVYDHLDFLNLNFGERLPQPEGSMRGFGAGSRAAEEFVRRIEPYERETRTWQDIQTFLHRFESSSAMKNPWVRRSIAWTQILAGKPEEGRAHLERLLNADGVDDYPHFTEDIRFILSAMDSSLDEARRCLLAWEVQTRRRLKIAESPARMG